MSSSTDDKKGPPRPGASSGDNPGQKRPYATIDLTATEVKKPDEKAKPDAGRAEGAKSELARPDAGKAGAMGPSASGPAKAEATPAAKPGSGGPDPKPATAGSVPPVAGQSAASGKPSTKPAGTIASPGASAAAGKPSAAAASKTSMWAKALGYVSAGVIGAIMALIGIDYIASGLGLDLRQAGLAGDVSTRLARVEKTLGDRAQAASPADPALMQRLTRELTEANARIARLEEANKQLAALAEGQQKLGAQAKSIEDKLGEGAAAPAEVAGRVARLEASLQGLASVAQTPPGQRLPEVARLTAKVNELETAITTLRKSAGPADLALQIDARLAEARKTEAQTAEAVNQLKSDQTRRLREIEAVKTQTERLEQRLDTVKSGLEQALGAARGETGNVKGSVDAMRGALEGQIKGAVGPLEQRLADLDGKLATIAQRDQDRQANAQRIVLSLELANLKRALDAGRPYGEALAQVEKLAGGMIDVSALKAHRERGVATPAELQTRFRDVARAVLDAEQDTAQGTTVNRLLASARSVVQVRRVGADVKGDAAEAVLARAEAHLKAGDLEQAAREAATLRPELRTAQVAAWLGQLEARLSVERALKAIDDKLKTSLAGGKGDK